MLINNLITTILGLYLEVPLLDKSPTRKPASQPQRGKTSGSHLRLQVRAYTRQRDTMESSQGSVYIKKLTREQVNAWAK